MRRRSEAPDDLRQSGMPRGDFSPPGRPALPGGTPPNWNLTVWHPRFSAKVRLLQGAARSVPPRQSGVAGVGRRTGRAAADALSPNLTPRWCRPPISCPSRSSEAALIPRAFVAFPPKEKGSPRRFLPVWHWLFTRSARLDERSPAR